MYFMHKLTSNFLLNVEEINKLQNDNKDLYFKNEEYYDEFISKNNVDKTKSLLFKLNLYLCSKDLWSIKGRFNRLINKFNKIQMNLAIVIHFISDYIKITKEFRKILKKVKRNRLLYDRFTRDIFLRRNR